MFRILEILSVMQWCMPSHCPYKTDTKHTLCRPGW